jgi:hypothetical protein
MRRQRERLACVGVTPEEDEVVGRIRAMCGVDSDANLLRIAVWSLADELGVKCPSPLFDCRRAGGDQNAGWFGHGRTAAPLVLRAARRRACAGSQPVVSSAAHEGVMDGETRSKRVRSRRSKVHPESTERRPGGTDLCVRGGSPELEGDHVPQPELAGE